MRRIPFLTPVDYWQEALNSDPTNINNFAEIQREKPYWLQHDNDLHVYPYTFAVPAMLSMGCNNQCSFCPTASVHKGNIHYGDPEIILPKYRNRNVHFMDENFLRNDMDKVLPLLKANNIRWLAMSDYESTVAALEKYGEVALWQAGCRVIEVGLENVVLMKKVKKPILTHEIEIYYLNMTFLPGETKESIIENSNWMRRNSLKRPIHFNNGLWYSPGQFYYPYSEDRKDGTMLETRIARTIPTFIPHSFLCQTIDVVNLELTNYYSQLVYGIKFFPKFSFSVQDFLLKISPDKRAAWIAVGLRCGGLA